MWMKTKNLARIRKGMTLVELMVAMAIIIMMAAITAAFYPSISSDNQISNTANKIQSLLVGARQKARRDKVPYGVRLIPDTTALASSDLMVVQKPTDLINGGSFAINGIGLVPYSKPFLNIVSFNKNVWFPSVGGVKEEDVVGTGDMLVVNPGHKSTIFYQDTSLPQNQMLVDIKLYPNVSSEYSVANGTWKIVRQARIVPGEETVTLPEGYEIALVDYDPKIPMVPCSALPPKISTTGGPMVNIIFDPSGSIANKGVSSDLYLWVHKQKSQDPNSDDAIIGIKKTTGRVGVFPVGPINLTNPAQHLPFQFANDPSNEGL